MKVVASYSIKGGVGKTATAVNLAYTAARAGTRTLVWDLDPQGASTFYFRVRPKVKGGSRAIVGGRIDLDDAVKGTDHEGLDLVPSDFTYRHMDLYLDKRAKPTRRIRRLLRPLEDQYDLVVLDCPPSISLVSENVFEAADALLVPVIPTTLSLRTLDQLHGFLDDGGIDVRVLPFLSMLDRRKQLHRELAEEFAQRPEALVTAVPMSAVVERMGRHRAPVTTYAPRTVAARAYRELWAEVHAQLT